MDQFALKRIGTIKADEDGMRVVLEPEYRPAMTGLAGFSHLNLIWWFSGCDSPQCRETTQEHAPYKTAPAVLGVFATRSPTRPNPLAQSCAQVTFLDEKNGVIGLAYVDAYDGTPLLDIKPYTPSLDRVERPAVPAWCAHWPGSYEDSGAFDWEAEFHS